jgi:hypothetical protein
LKREAYGCSIDRIQGRHQAFSTRHNTNEFVTVLANSDGAEAEDILQNFTKDFQEQGIRQIQTGVN